MLMLHPTVNGLAMAQGVQRPVGALCMQKTWAAREDQDGSLLLRLLQPLLRRPLAVAVCRRCRQYPVQFPTRSILAHETCGFCTRFDVWFTLLWRRMWRPTALNTIRLCQCRELCTCTGTNRHRRYTNGSSARCYENRKWRTVILIIYIYRSRCVLEIWFLTLTCDNHKECRHFYEFPAFSSFK